MTSSFYTTVTPKTGKGYLCLGLSLTILGAPLAEALEYQFDNHQFELGFRPRVAYVEADEDGRAASLLLRASATSAWTDALSTLLEIDYVELGWEDQFSNGEHFNDKPAIPDVGGIDLNQALLRYSLTNTLQINIGRETVNLGNERFVGSNSFWQNEQTLDNAGLKYSFGTASHVSYRYIDNANRIFGDAAGKNLSPSDSNFVQNNGLRSANFLGNHEHNSHLLFAEFKEWDYARLQAYYFDMDIKDAQLTSNDTLGLRYEFKGSVGKLRALAHAEVALQERPEVDKDALIQYYNLGAGIGYRANEISFNAEVLGANKGISFATPLASLHDFNGWTDKFLTTPEAGLRDYSAQYIWRKNPWKIDARYHFFHSDENNTRYGKEFDVDFSVKFSRNSTLLLRYTDFIADDDSYTDEQRIFLMYIYNL